MPTMLERIIKLRLDTQALVDSARVNGADNSLSALPDVVSKLCEKLAANRYLVLVMGEAKRGKSTFINAVIGRNVLPTSERIATSQVFRIGKETAFACRLRFEDDSEQVIPESELIRYGSQTYDGEVTTSKLIRWIEVDVPGEAVKFLPEGISLLDTPGLGSLHAAHGQITRRFIPLADGVIYVLDSEKPLGDDDIKYLEEALDITSNVFFIQTRIDQFGAAWQDIVRRNQEILRERFGERLGSFAIWPISSTNLIKAAATGDKDYLRVSRFAALAEALQLFLFRSAGLTTVAQIVAIVAEHLREGHATLEQRLKNLTEESRDRKAETQRRIGERRQQFETKWGDSGAERRELIIDLRRTLQQARTQFSQSLSPTGAVDREFQASIDGLSSVSEATALGRKLGDALSAKALDEWQSICRNAWAACVARLSPLMAAAESVKAPVLGDDVEIETIRSAKVTARDDLWTLAMGGRMASMQSGMTAAVGAGLVSVVIGFSWFPPVAAVAVAGAAIWGFFRGASDTRARQVEQARQELRRHLALALAEIRNHFFDVQVDRQSVVDAFFGGVEKRVFAHIDELVRRKVAEVDSELKQLREDAELEDQRRASRISEVKSQVALWVDTRKEGKRLLEGLEALNNELAGHDGAQP